MRSGFASLYHARNEALAQVGGNFGKREVTLGVNEIPIVLPAGEIHELVWVRGQIVHLVLVIMPAAGIGGDVCRAVRNARPTIDSLI